MVPLKTQETAKRFVVLLPDYLEGNFDLAQKIHRMAARDNCPVLYLTMIDDDEEMLTVSRSMATLKAQTAGNRLVVESLVTNSSDWLKTLEAVYRPGDVLVCQEEDKIVSPSFQTVPVGDFLAGYLHAPVTSMPALYRPDPSRFKQVFLEFFPLIGFLVIAAVFTWLEILLDRALDGSLRTILVTLVFCIEVAAFLAWYKASNR
jgi:hypothetical protein